MSGARLVLIPVLTAAVAGGACLRPPVETATSDNAAAEHYVRLVLALGLHDPDFVDAYYGPPAWRTEVEQAKWPLQEINKRAAYRFYAGAAASPVVRKVIGWVRKLGWVTRLG